MRYQSRRLYTSIYCVQFTTPFLSSVYVKITYLIKKKKKLSTTHYTLLEMFKTFLTKINNIYALAHKK